VNETDGGNERDDGLPLYATSDDAPRARVPKGAVALGIVAVVLAIAGDLLIATHAGQAVVLLVLAVVAISAAVVLNRAARRAKRG
jgi:hypothetical protein